MESDEFKPLTSKYYRSAQPPIERRIKYQCACLCYKLISCSALVYLSELVELCFPSRSLRSAFDTRVFDIPAFKRKQHGQCAFSYSADRTWNYLPFSVRHSPSFSAFKSGLKTYLFEQYFFFFLSGHCASLSASVTH